MDEVMKAVVIGILTVMIAALNSDGGGKEQDNTYWKSKDGFPGDKFSWKVPCVKIYFVANLNIFSIYIQFMLQ